MICIFVYERDAARNRHLRQLEKCTDWPAAFAYLRRCVVAQPGACFEIEVYPDAPGDADGE